MAILAIKTRPNAAAFEKRKNSIFCDKVWRMDHEVARGARGARRVTVLSACFTISGVFVLSAVLEAQQPAVTLPFDTAAVERGQKLHVDQCSFCHGANARGGSGGPDLTRSALVQTDEDGKQLGEFLAVGRPDRGMPKFDFSPAQVSDVAAFLHSAIYLNANRRLYKILDIVVGDASAGQAYFNGAGKCNTCHSPTGNLKGVGAKYEPATLQRRLLMPRGREAQGEGPPVPLFRDPTAIKATVTLPSGESLSGGLVRLTDFEVTIYETASGRTRSWLRTGDVPKVVVIDPLQAHVDHLTKWTDADMHNMTAYLSRLK
jgi:mono/diheme cytochrome c family protein